MFKMKFDLNREEKKPYMLSNIDDIA